MLSLTRDMLLLTREEEKIAEARKFWIEEGRGIGREEGIEEGRGIGIEEGIPIGEERTRRLFIDRLMARGMSYDEVIDMLGLNKA